MASITIRTDDLTGENLPEDTPTTTIRINDPRWTELTDLPAGVSMDLSDTSVKTLIKALEKFARKGTPITATSIKSTTDEDARKFAKDARTWAIITGLQPPVSDRGAVPQRALDAYREHLAQQDGENVNGLNPDGSFADTDEK